ncbi:non-specific lipid-transfer protein 2-like isoform X2 [Ananas comosus]|uniref:Non-specific lipid-transfer protein n=1 Tax=Ananas comosus TaxID=4615 RepID=A0A6P5FTF0_ANACO|nr:non-specific lipid-transfer protein 2-like isoform X2 [Ananas comosus]
MVVPCVPYLTDRAAVPFGPCCNEVVALNRTASTRQDRVTICRCLEGAAPRFPRADFKRAAALPRLCGVVLHNITISPNLDCSSLP